MRGEAIFLNGVYESVLVNIFNIQKFLPEQILYLQPYSSERIIHLAENLPSVNDPVRLLMSLTTDLPNVHFICEIVGWENKQILSDEKLDVLNKLIYSLQWPGEPGIYKTLGNSNKKPLNLLFVRRMERLSKPFSVTQLKKSSSGEPLSPDRSTSGGWTYIENPDDVWLHNFK